MANEDDDAPRLCFLKCGSGCLAMFVTFVINLIVLICLASLLVWMMLGTNAVKFHVNDASLTQFDLENNNNNLYYNLFLNFTIHNSNSNIGILCDKFEATVFYSDQRVASVAVPSFYQGHKSTKVLETVFQGQNLVLLGENGRQKFEDDTKLGTYDIDVKVRIKSRVLFAHLVTWPMKPTVTCHLNVPVASPSTPHGGFEFQSTKCHLNF